MTLVLPKAYLSYSQVSCWGYSHGQYLDRYIYGKAQIETPALIYGKQVSEWLENGNIHEAPRATQDILARLITPAQREYEIKDTFETPLGSFEFLGYADGFTPSKTGKDKIVEYKTGAKLWDKTRADKHLQTQLYAAIIYRKTGKIPQVQIQWIQTHVVDGETVPTGVLRIFRVQVTVASMMTAMQEMIRVAQEIHTFYDGYRKGLEWMQV